MQLINSKAGKIVGAVALGATLLPVLVLAQGSGISGSVNPPIRTDFSFAFIVRILNTVVSWIFTVFLIVAIIFVILAAFSYLTAAGDPEKVKTASKQLVYAAIAIAVALLSASLRFAVQNLLGVTI